MLEGIIEKTCTEAPEILLAVPQNIKLNLSNKVLMQISQRRWLIENCIKLHANLVLSNTR
jgi:hypothetical protein